MRRSGNLHFGAWSRSAAQTTKPRELRPVPSDPTGAAPRFRPAKDRPVAPLVHADALRAGKRRWTINGDFLTIHPTGVARYAREVTLALDELVCRHHHLTADLEIDVVAPRQPKDPLGLKAISMRIAPEFRTPRIPQFWVQAQLPWHVRGGLLSFCNLAPVAVSRQIVCIHDLNTRLAPESYGLLFRAAHRVVLPVVGWRAARITTVSQLSRSQLIAFGVAPPSKISVTFNGSDHVLRWDATRSALRGRYGRPYVLCIGRREKHKNSELLVRLAPMLDPLGLDIWMAGDLDAQAVQDGSGHMPVNLRLLGRISDNDLKGALQEAVCFLFPSRIEGFGLPAIEAMAAGCPVIASSSTCLPEICGDAALYGDPDDPVGWAVLVRQIQDSPDLQKRLVQAGHEQARAYSWRAIAESYLALMAEVDAGLPIIQRAHQDRR